MERSRSTQHGQIGLLHPSSERLDACKEGTDGDFPLSFFPLSSQLRALYPEKAVHIVAFETHARYRYVRKVYAVVFDIDTSVAVLCTIEINVINVER